MAGAAPGAHGLGVEIDPEDRKASLAQVLRDRAAEAAEPEQHDVGAREPTDRRPCREVTDGPPEPRRTA